MDFKSLRTQILANLDNYNEKESKVVIIKLLDFLIDINDKRTHLEEENKQLFEEMSSRKVNVSDEDYKERVEEIIEKANKEAAKRIEHSENEAKQIIESAKKNTIEIIEHAEKKGQEIIDNSIEQMKELVKEIEKTDDEAKLYRAHILSIFRKTIFRFSDSNYYIIRSDDKDFRELLNFFEVDEKLQKICDENIQKLANNENFKRVIEQVSINPEVSEIVEIKDILGEKDKIDDKKIEEIKAKIEIEQTETGHNNDVETETNNITTNKKFLEIMNKYKKNKE